VTDASSRARARRRTVAAVVVLCLLAALPAGAREPAGSEPTGTRDVIARHADDRLLDHGGRAQAHRPLGGAQAHRPLRGAEVRTAEPAALAGALLVTTDSPAAARGLARAQARSQAVAARVVKVHVPPGQEAAAAARLQRQPGVVAVEPVYLRHFAATPNDPDYPRQWAHTLTGIEQAWAHSTGSAGVHVAVVDSGTQGTHPDLRGNLVAQVDVSTGSAGPERLGIDNDSCEFGHGTRVAGVVGAIGNNGINLAGVNWGVSILDLAITSQENGCVIPDYAVVAAIDYARQAGVDVINLSLGAPQSFCPAGLQGAIDDARAAGIAVVAASGNFELDPTLAGTPAVPASCNGVISVGAVGPSGTHAAYSTTNEYVDLAAPGGDFETDGFAGLVWLLSHDGGIVPDQGTSYASPYVAGLAALLRAIRPELSPDDLESILERTALDRGESGRDPMYGWGLVQAGPAADWAASGAPVPAPEPDPLFPVGTGGFEQPPPEPRDPELFRISAGTGSTTAVGQAVAVSQSVFPDRGAVHAVITRHDDFADALAGSTLAFGVGPMLFTSSTGPLATASRNELLRVLPQGWRVYLLGGSAALPTTLEDELRSLGYEPVRLWGRTREETAVAVAHEIRRRLPELGHQVPPVAILATRGNWPDAVAAGSIGAFFGLAVLLTPVSFLHPATEEALGTLDVQALYVVGGTAAVSDAAARAAVDAAGISPSFASRLSGPERTATAVAVADELELLYAEILQRPPGYVVGVNVRRADGFAHVLSASTITAAFAGVFVPIEGDRGTILTQPARDYVHGLRIDAVLAGDVDLVAQETGDLLLSLLKQ
jgi:subtilisin family serine protease/putative cell wall-binding protein